MRNETDPRLTPTGPLSAPPFDPPPSGWSLFWRGFALSVGTIAAMGLLLMAVALAVYVYVALTLPSPEELQARAASFVSTRILDRHGNLLYVINDPTGGRRTLVHLDDIPLHLRNATIASEDPTFYTNPGFNPLSIARAVIQNVTEGEIMSGASTITQQLVKTLFVGREMSLKRKIKEAVLASEITRTYSKDQILQIYLNEIYYGNLAYGVQAAAETYFGKQVGDLTLAESALLVGIVPSPVAHDPYENPEAALAARAAVLDAMVKHAYITSQEAAAAKAEPLRLAPRRIEIKAPHFVVYVRQLLEQKYGTEMVYRGGLQVETTLDLRMQQTAERVAAARIAELAGQRASNAALVALDPQTGEIRAMLGSVDFFDTAIDGQVNVALRPRQPGSSIKPLTYEAAFERGWSPATMIMDVKTQFPDGANPPYEPPNYDGKEHGPVSVRTALANSYNIPAVKALQYIGVPALLEMAQRLGITSLTRPDYGLSLTLGGGEVTLLEMTNAYAAFAAGGVSREPVAILRIRDSEGTVIEEHRPGPGRQVLDPGRAYLITHILADNEARTPMFGANSALRLSVPAAAKTGTTNDYKDCWTIGYTTSLVAGVWVGNSDGSAMDRVAGSSGAGPIWHAFMEEAVTLMAEEGKPAQEFPRPDNVVDVEVCAVSGQLPGPDCPHKRLELFIRGSEPKEPCSVHVKLRICRVSGKLAGEHCPAGSIEEKLFERYPEDGRDWAQRQGIPQPPTEACDIHTGQVVVAITSPQEGDEVEGEVGIHGTAEMGDMRHYRVEYGSGRDPNRWERIKDEDSGGIRDGHLATWDTRGLRQGTYTLRLIAFDSLGNGHEARVRVRVRNRPTPTATETPTPTATASPTITETPEPTETETPTETSRPSRTPRPSHTPEGPTATPAGPTPEPSPGATGGGASPPGG